MVNREFEQIRIETTDKAFIYEGFDWKKTAVVTFFDANHTETDRQEYGYLTADELYELIENQPDGFRLDRMLVAGGNLDEYRRRKGIEPGTAVRFPLISAEEAIFYCEEASQYLNFSFADFTLPDLSFRGSFFIGADLNFEGARFAGGTTNFEYILAKNAQVNFKSTDFGQGDVSFKNAIFCKGHKYFEHACFGKGDVLFTNAEFNDGDVVFEHVTFGQGNVNFKVARFGKGRINFHEAAFGKGETTFERSEFGEGELTFRQAVFQCERVSFNQVNFGSGSKNFERADFGKSEVTFVNCNFGEGKVNFKNAVFEGEKVDFHFSAFSEGDLLFDRTRFRAMVVDFKAVKFASGKLSFNRTDFGSGELSFEASELNNSQMIFRNCTFEGGTVNFAEANFAGSQVLFDTIDFDRKIFTFRNSVFDQLNIIGSQINNYFDIRIKSGKIDLSDTIIRDIIDLRPHNEVSEIAALNLSGVRLLGKIYIGWYENRVKELIYQQAGSDLLNLSEQFRVLKENFNSIGQYEDEDKAYVEFKRTELKALRASARGKKPLKRIAANLSYAIQWILFDKTGLYATDPLRVLTSMIFVYLVFVGLYLVLPLFTMSDILSGTGQVLSTVAKSFYFSAITFLTIGFGDYYPIGFSRVLAGVEGFAGLFMMSYFTVAFVRKILR